MLWTPSHPLSLSLLLISLLHLPPLCLLRWIPLDALSFGSHVWRCFLLQNLAQSAKIYLAKNLYGACLTYAPPPPPVITTDIGYLNRPNWFLGCYSVYHWVASQPTMFMTGPRSRHQRRVRDGTCGTQHILWMYDDTQQNRESVRTSMEVQTHCTSMHGTCTSNARWNQRPIAKLSPPLLPLTGNGYDSF